MLPACHRPLTRKATAGFLFAIGAGLLVTLPAFESKAQDSTNDGKLDAGGGIYRGEIVGRSKNRVLVKTGTGSNTGLAWVDASLATPVTENEVVPDYDSELARARTFVSMGRDLDASPILHRLVRRDFKRKDTRLLFAQVLRRTWHFRPSLVLLERLVDEDSSKDLELLRQLAEVAVLAGDTRAGNKYISKLRLAARRDDRMKAYCDAMRVQLDGGAQVVFAGAVPVTLDATEQARLRRNFDAGMGDSLYEARLAQEIRDFARETDGPLVERCVVRATIGAHERAAYAAGSDERTFAFSASRVEAWLMVNEQGWSTRLFGWQQKVILYGAVFRLQKGFARAKITVRIVFREPSDPSGNTFKTPEAARAELSPDSSLTVDFKVPGRRDPNRDASLLRERQDHDKRR